MKISLKTYPFDIILCLLASAFMIPLVFLNIEPTIRLIIGLPFILFIPGYVLVFALFPARKTDRGIDTLERIVLSFGLSIAIVPLIGLVLNYTPWGIRLEPILLSLFFFILSIGLFGVYRWWKTDPEERFIISFQLTLPKSENKIDRALTIILIIAILIVIASLLYVITMPKTGETFTEFYLLGPTGKAEGYPRNLTTQENATVTIGIANHENRLINYSIEIWLINQTTVYNNTTHNNETLYAHAWFMDSVTVMLNHTPAEIETAWKPQWDYNYTFNIDKKGNYKIAFLLFTTPTDTYNHDIDYKDSIAEKITNAYRETHLFVTVS